MSQIADLLLAAGQRVLALEQSQSLWQSGDTEELNLYNLLRPLIPGERVSPDMASEPTFPYCVYSVSDAGTDDYRGVTVAHSVLFGVSLRDTNRAALAELAVAVANQLHAQTGVAILGRASAYEQERQCYVMAMEVVTSIPVGFDVTAVQPFAVLTLPTKERGINPQSDHCGMQTIEREHHVIIYAATQAGLEQQRHTLHQLLHWKKLPDAFRPLEFSRGEAIPAAGGLLAWVDVWLDSYRLRPA